MPSCFWEQQWQQCHLLTKMGTAGNTQSIQHLLTHLPNSTNLKEHFFLNIYDHQLFTSFYLLVNLESWHSLMRTISCLCHVTKHLCCNCCNYTVTAQGVTQWGMFYWNNSFYETAREMCQKQNYILLIITCSRQRHVSPSYMLSLKVKDNLQFPKNIVTSEQYIFLSYVRGKRCCKKYRVCCAFVWEICYVLCELEGSGWSP